jgi:DNA-binding NtrC family response regulator
MQYEHISAGSKLMTNATILVVDDEALIRWSLTDRLRTEGCDVLEAETGEAALHALSEGVDVVLLDYRLPDTDGASVLRRIKAFDPDIVVIILTAYVSDDTVVELMEQGAFRLAGKPFNLDAIASLVAQGLAAARLRQQVRRYWANAPQPSSL